MSLRARPCDAAAFDEAHNADADYLCVRSVDALLRENVRECVTHAEVVGAAALPPGMAASFDLDQRWLQIRHFSAGRLWIPVTPSRFMQPWRLTRLPLIWCDAAGCRCLYDIADILACFRQGLDESAAGGFTDFEHEYAVALAHRHAAKAERERWFGEWRAANGARCGADLPHWHKRLLHYDRLASFLDHPFYPTARAKLGFAVADLARYAPEFQPTFELNWIAVPLAQYRQSGDRLPPGWPGFADVGLPASLAASHALVPVHPFMWRRELDRFLAESALTDDVVRAPRAHLVVAPTLSVRTLALAQTPAWHVKLPLTIRTLGAKNIRTIKPSTIHDGHCIQSLLGAIAEREPVLRGRVLLTEEDTGAHVANRNFLGFIVRRYPQHGLRHTTLVPVAAFAAATPRGVTVFEELADRYFGGDRQAFFDEYVEATLALHLRLWLRYGVALESNQQNSVVVLSDSTPRLRLLLKDNDAARIQRDYLARRWPALASRVADLHDGRIVVRDALPLAQMFTTITLQLNIAALVQAIAERFGVMPDVLYAQVRLCVERILGELEAEGEDIAFARRVLLEDEHLAIKYLLVAATLSDKKVTGAADVNKYYGKSAPNFLRAIDPTTIGDGDANDHVRLGRRTG